MSAERDRKEDRADGWKGGGRGDDDDDGAAEEAAGGGWSNVSVRTKNGREEQRRTNGPLGWTLQHTPRYTEAAEAVDWVAAADGAYK